MAKTPSKMISLGTRAKDFSLLEPYTGKKRTLKELSQNKKGILIAFICNHCPFVKHLKEELIKLADEYIQKGIGFIGINSNDVENYPEDAPEKMKKENYSFAYLFDATQAVAKSYEAACTPDFFLFDEKGELYYRGQMDDSRPGNEISPTGKDLRENFNLLLNDKPATMIQKPSIGCNIKWKV